MRRNASGAMGAFCRCPGPSQVGVSGHFLFLGAAPLFASTKLQVIEALRVGASPDPQTGAPGDGDASVILRMLKVHTFPCRAPRASRRVPTCPRCFAELILAQASAQ